MGLKRNIKEIMLILLLAVSGIQVRAQLISVKSMIDRDSMLTGEQVAFTLRVEAAPGVSFTVPEHSDTLNRAFEVLSYLGRDTISDGEGLRVDHRYLITSFEPGQQMIPSMEVFYSYGHLSDTARSMPYLLFVDEPVVDTSQAIKALKPPMNTPVSFREVLPWSSLALAAIALAFVLIWLIRKYLLKKDDSLLHRKVEEEAAHIIAFRELDRLKLEKVWERGEVKPYYSDLTRIIRAYIEKQYGIPTMESTSGEIMTAFQKSNRQDILLDEMLNELLQLSDLVKFAKEDPMPDENLKHLNNIYVFVQKTYPEFYQEQEDE